jgi:hypothetical protein
VRLVPGESLRTQPTEEGLVRLVRLLDGNFGLTENGYLQRRKAKHGYVYQVVDEQAEGSVLVAKSISTGAEITVMREHVEDLPVDA